MRDEKLEVMKVKMIAKINRCTIKEAEAILHDRSRRRTPSDAEDGSLGNWQRPSKRPNISDCERIMTAKEFFGEA